MSTIGLKVDTNVSEGHVTSIFRVQDEDSMLKLSPGTNLQVHTAARSRN